MTAQFSVQADEASLRRFRDELYDDYGIYFPEKKFYQLKAKIGKRLRSLQLESLEAYEEYLLENPGEISDLLDAISTNTTKFYREPKHWDFLREELIPNWKSANRKVLAWSAACSSGEEPYTLSLLLERNLENQEKLDYRVLATDLSKNVLKQGVRGVYPAGALEPLAEEYPGAVDEYFEPIAGDKREIKERIRDHVVFRKFNLKSGNYPYKDKFDLVVLRNVIIYFDRKMTRHVIDNLTASLNDGGYLFTGHSESLSQVEHALDKIKPAIYRKS